MHYYFALVSLYFTISLMWKFFFIISTHTISGILSSFTGIWVSIGSRFIQNEKRIIWHIPNPELWWQILLYLYITQQRFNGNFMYNSKTFSVRLYLPQYCALGSCHSTRSWTFDPHFNSITMLWLGLPSLHQNRVSPVRHNTRADPHVSFSWGSWYWASCCPMSASFVSLICPDFYLLSIGGQVLY